MEIRAAEQDDLDKQGISLMGVGDRRYDALASTESQCTGPTTYQSRINEASCTAE